MSGNQWTGIFLLVVLMGGCSQPHNYDECVMEKMKGQPQAMIDHAQNLCEAEFPYERILYGYKNNIEVEWLTLGNLIYVNIPKNHGGYNITRYKASFAKQCEPTSGWMNRDVFTLTKTFEFKNNETTSTIDVGSAADEYRCMRTDEIHGIKVKK